MRDVVPLLVKVNGAEPKVCTEVDDPRSVFDKLFDGGGRGAVGQATHHHIALFGDSGWIQLGQIDVQPPCQAWVNFGDRLSFVRTTGHRHDFCAAVV